MIFMSDNPTKVDNFEAETKRLKFAWNRFSHSFLADYMKKGVYHPFYEPQHEVTRRAFVDYLETRNPGVDFSREERLFRPLSNFYYENRETIHRHAKFLENWFGYFAEVLGVLRQNRLKNKSFKKISVLDIGCGSGNFYESFKKVGLDKFINYIGIDIAEKNIENCKVLYPKVDFQVGNLFSLEFPSDAFDVVMVNKVFEHLPPQTLDQSLREAVRVTRRRLIINFFSEKDIPYHIIMEDETHNWNCLSRSKITAVLNIPIKNITIIDKYFGKNISFLTTWRQTFNATGMSTIYPYAEYNGIPASHRRRARGGEPRPGAGRELLGNRAASGSSAEYHNR